MSNFSKIGLRAALLSGVALYGMLLGSSASFAQEVRCDNRDLTLPTDGTYVSIFNGFTCSVTIQNSTFPVLQFPQTNVVSLFGPTARAIAPSIVNNSIGYAFPTRSSLINVGVGGRIESFINNGDFWGAGNPDVPDLGHTVLSVAGGIQDAFTDIPGGVIEYFLNNTNAVIGTLSGRSETVYAIDSAGEIGTLINLGQMFGDQASIRNFGTINELHNAQGGAQPLSFAVKLPNQYFIVIRGTDDFGRLRARDLDISPPGDSGMVFGISGYSTRIRSGTYTDVLNNIPGSAIDPTTRSGSSSRYEWDLIENPITANSWDLFLRWLGSDPVNTRLALQSNANAVRSVLSQNAATTTYALDYDCSVFDKHGFCFSIGLRNSQVGSYSDSGETAGVLIGSYRITPNFRVGGFIDQNFASNSRAGVTVENSLPVFGAFAAYQQNLNHLGLTVRAALAYQQSELRIARPEVLDTEAGTGRVNASALAFGGEIGYGFAIDPAWVAQPYVGMQRSDSKRQGYTEAASVEYPITYNSFGQMVTSATAGLRLHGAITPKFSVTFGVGVEHDLDSKMDRYTGSTGIVGTETFSINVDQDQNKTRMVGSAGVRYMVAPNQAVAFDASIRRLPIGNDPSISTMLRYSVGF